MRCTSLMCGVAAASLLAGCGGGGGGGDPAPQPQNPQPPPAQTSHLFVDVTAQSGLDYVVALDHGLGEIVASTFGGVAAGDYNGDGLVDLYIVRGDGDANLLYRNEGNLTFTDVAGDAGVAYTKSASATENYGQSGPTFADMDGDGHLDLFIGGIAGDPSTIFRNNGDGTFTDVTVGSGIDTLVAENSISAAFGDYDLDGYIDLAIAHWGSEHESYPDVDDIDTETLWRNVSGEAGRIKFESVSVEAGISPDLLTLFDPLRTQPEGTDFTFSPTFARIDDDIYPDLLLVGDFNTSQFYLNDRDGTFTNATDLAVFIDDNGMGSAVGDYDNDGDLDWFVSSIRSPDGVSLPAYPGAVGSRIGNRLYRNEGDGEFADATRQAGVANGGWGWAACFADFNLDGHLDIYHTNGWENDTTVALDYSEDSGRLFISDGDGAFQNRADELGIADTYDGRSVVCADFDNDGDVDVLLLHKDRTRSVTLWENTGITNNYLRVQLNGLPPNTEAANARIKVRIGEVEQMREIMIGSNYTSQNPTVQVFGLGASSIVDELTVEWPGGVETSQQTAVSVNRTVVLEHPSP